MKFLNGLLLACVLVVSQGAVAAGPNPGVILETTKGTIEIELYADKAPKSVANFLAYVKAGFYDGTIFHRVIPGFMVQGGGLTPDMAQKDTRDPIQNEADNGVQNTRGTLAMARTGDPHSATAQFFINVADNPFLDYKAPNQRGYGYCVFGKVIEGLDVVDKIKSVETGEKGMFTQDCPKVDVVIKKVRRADK